MQTVARRLDPERSKKVIQALGGTCRVAELFGISHASVSLWSKNGIPEARLQFIQVQFKKIPAIAETLDFHPWRDRV
jgi:hypothetical protein